MTTRDRVALAYIHPEHVSAGFMGSVIDLIHWDTLRSDGHLLRGGKVMAMGSGPNVSTARNRICEAFLTTDAEWLWILDTDMTFEPDTLDRLLEVADPNERPIVGGLCHAKKELPSGLSEYFPTLYYFTENLDSYRLQVYPPNELVEVDATGAACLLIHRTVLETVGERHAPPFPWFQESVMGGKPYGEDITFCLRAKAAGFPIFVHTGIEIGHIKQDVVTAETYREWWVNEITEPEFVIAGTGRSGTGFISRAFRLLGVNCGHEEWWNPFNRRGPRLLGDASWLSVPHLGEYGGKVGLQLRDPLKTFNSLLNGQIFGEGSDKTNPYYRYKAAHMDMRETGETADEMTDVALFIVEWTERAEKHAQKVWRLEDLDGDLFSEVVEAMTVFRPDPELAQRALDAVPKSHNKHPNTTAFGWGDLPDDEPFDRMRDLARRHGYL